MIQFNELRITPDAKYLIIDAQIKEDSYFDVVTITKLTISKVDNEESTTVLKEVSKELFEDMSLTESEYGTVRIRTVISSNELGVSLSNAYIEVIVETDGETTATSPVEYANPVVTVAVVDLYPFYINSLHNIRMLNNLFSNNDELIDCILRFKALEMAFKTGNTSLAKQYWFKYFATLDNTVGRNFVIKNCYE